MHIMISCGEASGDLYGGALAAELGRLDPNLRITGLGGDRLRVQGANQLDYRGLSVTGLSEALAVLPRSWRTLRRLVATATADRPDVFVAIDFPDFNFRLASAMKRLNVPIVYYVGPQIWAWRSGRLSVIKRLVDRMLVIFPFEEALYRDAGVPVEFVGHPLVELTPVGASPADLRARLGVAGQGPVVGLLPGSRTNEVRAILPGLYGAARLIAREIPAVRFVVARAPGLSSMLFDDPHGHSSGPPPTVVEGRADDVLGASDVVLTASGTATVQAALHGRPMVIVYRLTPLTYRLGRPFVRVKTYGMVNLIAGETVVPELIQDDFTPETVAREAIALLTDEARAERVRQDLARVRTRLGAPGASRRAAEAVIRTAQDKARAVASVMSRG